MLLRRLEIRNCRRIKQADVDFHGPGLQVIQGANKSGKSTLAQSIALTLEGTKSYTPGMITHGEEKAEIIAFTDDGLQIKTSIKDTVKQTVSRFDDTAGRYVSVSGGVREFLNSIRSGLEMPWALRSMTDAQIIEILKNRAGVSGKIEDIDNKLKVKELARTDVGRDKKKLGELGEPPEKAEHPPKIDDLKTEREAALKFLKSHRETLDKAAEYIRGKCSSINTLADIENMKGVIDEAYICAQKHIVEAGKPYTPAEVDAMDKRFIEWNKEEEKAKAWDTYTEKKKNIEELTKQYEALTKEIEALRELRKKTLSGITLIKGLEIGDDNMLRHNGILRGITDSNNVDNWSTAESVQVFFSIGAAFSGEMKTLVVDNAESLDGETTKAISVWAEKSAFLVILLKVADMPESLEEGIIYLKEGEVVTK
jgi:DNA repair exonuclease SbcCD ATPase subunit